MWIRKKDYEELCDLLDNVSEQYVEAIFEYMELSKENIKLKKQIIKLKRRKK